MTYHSDLYALLESGNKIDPETALEILNLDPPKEWLKKHNDLEYLPIEKVEYLLRVLFDEVDISVISHSITHDKCVVAVRVIAKLGLKTFKAEGIAGESANGKPFNSILQSAKSYATKDACDSFGKIFGRDLNRTPIEENSPEFGSEEVRVIHSIFNQKDKAGLNKLYVDLTNKKSFKDLYKPFFRFADKQLTPIEARETPYL